MLLKKVRVTYNKCHTFWRGKVISVHKSVVDKQVDAAKVSAVLRVTYNKCHTFWRGKVISVHKSVVDKQVDAAKVSAVLCGNRTQDDGHGDGDMCLIALLIQLAWLLHFHWGHQDRVYFAQTKVFTIAGNPCSPPDQGWN